MKRFYAIYKVEEFRKKFDDTNTHLKSWGYNYGADRLGGEIVIATPDEQTPEKNQLFLVTIEPIDRASVEEYGDSLKFFASRREKDANENSGGMKTGRKFR